MSTDGKRYEVRHFTEEGVYILSMLADTPLAREFRAKLARLLREIRERRVALARESGYLQGKDEARSLPVVQAERKAGYLEGLREGQRYRRSGHGDAAVAAAMLVDAREQLGSVEPWECETVGTGGGVDFRGW